MGMNLSRRKRHLLCHPRAPAAPGGRTARTGPVVRQVQPLRHVHRMLPAGALLLHSPRQQPSSQLAAHPFWQRLPRGWASSLYLWWCGRRSRLRRQVSSVAETQEGSYAHSQPPGRSNEQKGWTAKIPSKHRSLSGGMVGSHACADRRLAAALKVE